MYDKNVTHPKAEPIRLTQTQSTNGWHSSLCLAYSVLQPSYEVSNNWGTLRTARHAWVEGVSTTDNRQPVVAGLLLRISVHVLGNQAAKAPGDKRQSRVDGPLLEPQHLSCFTASILSFLQAHANVNVTSVIPLLLLLFVVYSRVI